ncbi:MAG: NAD(P)-dependent glycerol-3-phosphate dehydrogenase [Candidatus Omnitrophica bacterium]|nr:NAD(P)-dependent glycerol-3-phosphate dehydrogenase [Candidatus Omnitrophota bacterium]
MKETVSILGAGSWGTTLAVILSEKSNLQITLWSPFEAEVKKIIKNQENKDFLPSIEIPFNVCVTSDLKAALLNRIIIIAVPVEHLKPVLRRINDAKVKFKNKIFISVMKGIEIKSLKRPSEIIKQELNINSKQIVVLSGPTIAKEVAKNIPTVATVASHSSKNAEKIQELFKETNLRLYTNSDVEGIETAGALKNVIAIACGISDGLGFGTNTKSALICRGLKEMMRFARALKINEKAFLGISGIGDLCTTCFSMFSRNRYVGEKIGKGEKIDNILKNMKMVAEGVTTVKSVYNLSRKYKIDMPITREIYYMLYKNKSPIAAVKDLMNRPLKAE